jgi:hypothetical protein
VYLIPLSVACSRANALRNASHTPSAHHLREAADALLASNEKTSATPEADRKLGQWILDHMNDD